MLNFGHLIKIKKIPLGMPQAVLLYFLRKMWDLCESEGAKMNVPESDVCWSVWEAWVYRKWYEVGGHFRISRCSELVGMHGFLDYVIEDHNWVFYPDILKAYLMRPMLLSVESWAISPANIDQTDVLHSLVTSDVLGNFKSDDIALFKLTEVQGRVAICQSQDTQKGKRPARKVLWYLPAEEEDRKEEGEWTW